MAGPHYHVRMRMGADSGNVCWHTRVPVLTGEQLTDGEIEQRARADAVKAFGQQAEGWTLIDADRKTR